MELDAFQEQGDWLLKTCGVFEKRMAKVEVQDIGELQRRLEEVVEKQKIEVPQHIRQSTSEIMDQISCRLERESERQEGFLEHAKVELKAKQREAELATEKKLEEVKSSLREEMEVGVRRSLGTERLWF